MTGFITHFGARYFGRHYFGHRYWVLPVPFNPAHRVRVLAVSRAALVAGPARSAANPDANRAVKVSAQRRSAAVAPQNRIVSAVVPDREAK